MRRRHSPPRHRQRLRFRGSSLLLTRCMISPAAGSTAAAQTAERVSSGCWPSRYRQRCTNPSRVGQGRFSAISMSPGLRLGTWSSPGDRTVRLGPVDSRANACSVECHVFWPAPFEEVPHLRLCSKCLDFDTPDGQTWIQAVGKERSQQNKRNTSIGLIKNGH